MHNFFDFISADYNFPFALSIALMLLFSVFEIVSFLLLGGALSHWLDSFLPDGVDVDVDLDADGLHAFDSLESALAWLYVGRVPMMMLMVLYFTIFGLTGFTIQYLIMEMFNNPLNVWLAAILTFIVSLFLMHYAAGLLYKVMPKDETTALSVTELVGREATIILGECKVGKPAQAKLTDQFNQTHYIMIEPELNLEQIGLVVHDVSKVDRFRTTFKQNDVLTITSYDKTKNVYGGWIKSNP